MNKPLPDGARVTVNAITCDVCKHVIFSRAHHDFHSCPCGAVSVDGGFEYLRVLWSSAQGEMPASRRILVQATRRELYQDWNSGKDKWGVFSPECILVEGEPESTTED